MKRRKNNYYQTKNFYNKTYADWFAQIIGIGVETAIESYITKNIKESLIS
ncbi:MAG: hypothetical protein ACRDA4_00850 [Filifactoraceae bacterium]